MSLELYRIDDDTGGTASPPYREYWMTNLPPPVRQLPIMYMVIPGSFRSALYRGVITDTDTDTDEPVYQDSTITQQLLHGIRYIHCEVSWDPKTSEWMCSKRTTLTSVVRQINIFAIVHPNEVILFDVRCRTRSDVEGIGLILNHLSPILFEKPTDDDDDDATRRLWYSRFSLHEICRTGRNVVLLNNWLTDYRRIFGSCLKHITTRSLADLEKYLPLAEISIFRSFRIPKYLLRLDWVEPAQSGLLSWCISLCGSRPAAVPSGYDADTKGAHAALKHAIMSPERRATADLFDNVFILTTSYESRIDIVELCLALIKNRFF